MQIEEVVDAKQKILFAWPNLHLESEMPVNKASMQPHSQVFPGSSYWNQ